MTMMKGCRALEGCLHVGWWTGGRWGEPYVTVNVATPEGPTPAIVSGEGKPSRRTTIPHARVAWGGRPWIRLDATVATLLHCANTYLDIRNSGNRRRTRERIP